MTKAAIQYPKAGINIIVRVGALCGYYWSAGDSAQAVFIDNAGDVWEWYSGGDRGGIADLMDQTRMTGSPAPPASGSALSGYEWAAGNSKQVAYLDSAGHVHELYVTSGGNWAHADLMDQTRMTGSPAPPASGSALSGYEWAAGNSKQVAYLDSAGHVHELYVTSGGNWAHADLMDQTRMTGSPAPPASGSALSGYEWAAGNSKQVAYLDSAGHVHELYVTSGGNWAHADLMDQTRMTGSPAPPAGRPALSGYEWAAGNSKQVAYLDSAGHVHELYVTSGGNWAHADLTRQAGASPAVGSALSGYEWAGGRNSKQVAYIDSAGDVQELYVTPEAFWLHEDLSARFEIPPAASGTALSGFQGQEKSANVFVLASDGNVYWLSWVGKPPQS
ncbi:hypothetical protein [Streptomyces sp. JNUCC 63]